MDQLTDALRAVVERFGEEALFDPDRLRSLLMDELGSRGVAMPDEVGSLTRLIDPSLVSTLRDEPPSAAVVTQKAQSEQLSEDEVTDLLTTLRTALSESAPGTSDDPASTGSQRAPASPDTAPRRHLRWAAVVASVAIIAIIAVAASLTRDDQPTDSTEAVATTTTVAPTPVTTVAPTPTTTVAPTPAPTSADIWAEAMVSPDFGLESILITGFSDQHQADCEVMEALADALAVMGAEAEGMCFEEASEFVDNLLFSDVFSSVLGPELWDALVFLEGSEGESVLSDLDLDAWTDATGFDGQVLRLRWPDTLETL